ncbi:AAA family ATPase [Picrophilus oshimae]|uniref:ATPase domain-containing protein n=1 Tax=Picrophilus torridus (strain ATCC 700027 / DSM 9790 / JCM 10055 / NBRC 100828 / KAW 2/3) TaxID=1122961 RepID=A0A8G2L7T1_PICTO|nr:ATP-binding protein [Picrophilus oshimae]SMD31437.1 hypothetical protein SAMN02745355_1378 [Picrophilus oshimae DSM 9789]
MLFDPYPKNNLNDLYDRRAEIERLQNGVKYPLTVIQGLRRTGKSSLVKSVLNDMIYIDIRKYSGKGYISYRDLIEEFNNAINRDLKDRLRDVFKNISGINILGNSISLSWKKNRVRLIDVLNAIDDYYNNNNKNIIITIDEIQELIKLKGYNFLNDIAYSFDNFKSIKFVLTGSQIGALHNYLKMDDYNSPLYGRAYTLIDLKPFNREQSMDFLKKGFNEFNIDFNDAENVYNTLGGIPGWLAYYGFRYVNNSKDPMNETIKNARNTIIMEFCNFIANREMAFKRYYLILNKCIERSSWSEIKNYIENNEGNIIPNSVLNKMLNNLIDYSFIKKYDEKYELIDNMMRYAFKDRIKCGNM